MINIQGFSLIFMVMLETWNNNTNNGITHMLFLVDMLYKRGLRCVVEVCLQRTSELISEIWTRTRPQRVRCSAVRPSRVVPTCRGQLSCCNPITIRLSLIQKAGLIGLGAASSPFLLHLFRER